jgi:hypothetical protein
MVAFKVEDKLPDERLEVIACGGHPQFVSNAKFDGHMWWRSNEGYGFTVQFSHVVWWTHMPSTQI